jgi:predicted secreted protein
MAEPKTVKGTLVGILLGDGATDETFAAFCGINAKTINFQTNTNEEFIYDCDNLDTPPWRRLTKSGRFLSVTGTGQLDSEALERYQEAYDDDDAVNAQIQIDVPAADGGGYWTAALMLTNFNITGNNGETTTVEISLESSGPVTWVPAT